MKQPQEGSTTKYVIKAKIEIDGVVEQPDVVGAVFGQTEGLLGEDLDLRELQKTGRIGRIDVVIKSKGGNSTGHIIVPSSLDRVETAVLAASLEVIDRVGPCTAKVSVDRIVDVREEKRSQIIATASKFLKEWDQKVAPESIEITGQVVNKVKTANIIKYGPEGVPAGPDIYKSEDIIIVEGRADILNLLKCGIVNTIAVEGTKIPKSIANLTKKRKVTAFLDGDRGGDLILKELMQVGRVHYVARAPKGKEVEDLTRKEIVKALSEKQPISKVGKLERHHVPQKPMIPYPRKLRRPMPKQRRDKPQQPTPRPITVPKPPAPAKPKIEVPKPLKSAISELKGTMKAIVLDDNLKKIQTVEVGELHDKLMTIKAAQALVFDGVITQRIVDLAAGKNLQYVIGLRQGNITKKPSTIKILTFDSIE